MKKLLVPFILIFFAISTTAFDMFIHEGKLIGEYSPAGLEGKISCFSHGRHVLDIIYASDSIELSINLFDPALQKIIDRENLLKEEIKNVLLQRLLNATKTIYIKTPRFDLKYDDCQIELHDCPTRFLKILCDEIVVSIPSYEIQRVDNYTVRLIKDNLTATLLSENGLIVHNGNITAHGDIILISFSYIPDENIKKDIEHAFKNRIIGGELSVMGYEENKVDSISYYGDVYIEPVVVREGRISFNVSGNEEMGGRVIKVNIGGSACLSDDIVIKYDGNVVREASSFDDIMNPNDDGSNPEYYKIMTEKEGMLVLISIPHFSEHEISINFVVENPLFRAIAILFALAVVALATIYLFK